MPPWTRLRNRDLSSSISQTLLAPRLMCWKNGVFGNLTSAGTLPKLFAIDTGLLYYSPGHVLQGIVGLNPLEEKGFITV